MKKLLLILLTYLPLQMQAQDAVVHYHYHQLTVQGTFVYEPINARLQLLGNLAVENSAAIEGIVGMNGYANMQLKTLNSHYENIWEYEKKSAEAMKELVGSNSGILSTISEIAEILTKQHDQTERVEQEQLLENPNALNEKYPLDFREYLPEYMVTQPEEDKDEDEDEDDKDKDNETLTLLNIPQADPFIAEESRLITLPPKEMPNGEYVLIEKTLTVGGKKFLAFMNDPVPTVEGESDASRQNAQNKEVEYRVAAENLHNEILLLSEDIKSHHVRSYRLLNIRNDITQEDLRKKIFEDMIDELDDIYENSEIELTIIEPFDDFDESTFEDIKNGNLPDLETEEITLPPKGFEYIAKSVYDTQTNYVGLIISIDKALNELQRAKSDLTTAMIDAHREQMNLAKSKRQYVLQRLIAKNNSESR